jgi:hypothetical protein
MLLVVAIGRSLSFDCTDSFIHSSTLSKTTTSHHVEQYDARSAYEGYAGERFSAKIGLFVDT